MSFTNHTGIVVNQPLLLASNDINGGTPHRHLTIDGNGRTHTLARIEQSPTINSKLDAITTALTATYEDTTLDVSALGAVGSSSASIDMNGKRHLALMLNQSATGGSGTLTNIALEMSLDNTTWFRSSTYLSLTEVSSGVYTLYHREENVGARYVRLTITDIMANPSATTCSFSRSL